MPQAHGPVQRAHQLTRAGTGVVVRRVIAGPLRRHLATATRAYPAAGENLRKALGYVQADPSAALGRIRIALEALLVERFAAAMGAPPKKPLIGDMLANPQFAATFERRVLSRMHAIRDLANIGVHGDRVTPADARRALNDLCEVITDLYGGGEPLHRRRAVRVAAAAIGVLALAGGFSVLKFGRRAARAAVCPSGMVHVTAGEVVLLEGQGDDPNLPGRSARVAEYCIDRTEVTARAYLDCVNRGGCDAPQGPVWVPADVQSRMAPHCTFGAANRAVHPMNCVTWAMADAYCTWRGHRLPTEAEWQRAAQPRPGIPFPWGPTPPTAEHMNGLGPEGWDAAKAMLGGFARPDSQPLYGDSDRGVTTSAVGSHPAGASPFGVHDLAGNVSEWTADSWQGDASRRILKGSAWTYSGSAGVATRPELTVWYRRPMEAGRSSPTIGFRCVAPVP